ncbi:MAG: sigma-70 family RNA polymerase sigma factor [Gemmataceae bacterium]|nr:sigma-70 family RNA polymerase sigma factor [Gemmataceae bacterium]
MKSLDDQDPFRERLEPLRWGLSVYLRALLPKAEEADAAFQETASRLDQSQGYAPKTKFAAWCNDIASRASRDLRGSSHPKPFGDALFGQLIDSLGPIIERLDRYPVRLSALLGRLPPPEQELLRRKYAIGLTAEQIALAEERPASMVSRDLTLLNATIVSSLDEEVRLGPPLPGGAMDLGRLSDQLLDGTINEDGRLVLETLLLADSTAQAHYLRHVALACGLHWKYRGEPDLPAPSPKRGLSQREKLVTLGFAVTCLAVLAFVAFVVGSRLNAW